MISRGIARVATSSFSARHASCGTQPCSVLISSPFLPIHSFSSTPRSLQRAHDNAVASPRADADCSPRPGSQPPGARQRAAAMLALLPPRFLAQPIVEHVVHRVLVPSRQRRRAAAMLARLSPILLAPSPRSTPSTASPPPSLCRPFIAPATSLARALPQRRPSGSTVRRQ